MKLSNSTYRAAINSAFAANISDPSIFWNPSIGFYVAPSSRLAPNDDYCVGQAYYSLNNNGEQNFSGSRSEYQPLAAGIRKYYATAPAERSGSLRDYVDTARFEAEFERSLRF